MNQGAGSTSDQRGCEFCEKQGLPIFPLRYAIARSDVAGANALAPALPDNLAEPSHEYTLPRGQHYTARVLRPGYLYVEDVERAQWSAYQVTPQGFLFPYISDMDSSLIEAMNPDQAQPIDSILQPPTRDIEFGCYREHGHAQPARCITIADPDEAGVIRMVFTHSAWTKRVWKAHAEAGSSAQLAMISFDIRRWRSGSHARCASFAEMGDLVAEASSSGQRELLASRERARRIKRLNRPCNSGCHSTTGSAGAPFQQPSIDEGEAVDLSSLHESDALNAEMIAGFLDDQDFLRQPVSASAETLFSVPAEMLPFMDGNDHPQPVPFAHSSQEYFGFSDQLEDLQRWARTQHDALSIEPLMVMLDDPVQIAAEIAGLMQQRFDDFMKEPHRYRRLSVSSAIMALRKAEEEQAVLQTLANFDDGNDRISSHLYSQAAMTFNESEKYHINLTPDDLASIRSNAWNRFQGEYDEGARAKWQKQHDAEIAAFDSEFIVPLARLHREVLLGDVLYSHMQNHYDRHDPDHGLAYLITVIQLIGTSQNIAGNFDLYKQWLSGEVSDSRNFLLRAFTFNNDALADQIARATADADFKDGGFPWGELISLYDSAFAGSTSTQARSWVAALVQLVSGIITDIFREVTDAPVRLYLHSMAALGGATGSRIIWVNTVATSGEIINGVIEAHRSATGEKLSSRAAKAELRRLNILGVSLEQRHAVGFIGVSTADGSLLQHGEFKALKQRYLNTKLAEWHSLMDRHVGVGLISGIVQAVSLNSLYKTATSGMQHEKREAWGRFGLASVGMAAGISDLAGRKLGQLRHPFMVARKGLWRVLRVVGRPVAFIAAFTMSLLDIGRGIREINEANYNLGAGYIVSGASGLAFIYALAIGYFAMAAFAFLLLVAASFLVGWLTPDRRKQWLIRCLWGARQEQGGGYKNLNIEMQELQAALR